MTNEELLTNYLETKDSDLLSQLYERMHDTLHYFAHCRTSSSDDADDLTQRLYLKLMNCQPQVIDSAETFLITMMRNLIHDHHRKKKRRQQLGSVALNDCDEIMDDRDTTAKVGALPDNVIKVMDQLPSEQRESIYFYHCRGLTTTETAEIMESDAEATETAVEEGMATLRRRLKKKKKAHIPIQAKHPETDEVVHTFPSIRAAMKEGFSQKCLYQALRRGKHYRDLTWSYTSA